MTFSHGGDWTAFYQRRGTLPLDFSASISPLGLPRGVRTAVERALDRADRYPDPFCRDLRRAIGGAWQVPPDWVLCGNGAGDLIERTVQAVRPKRALVTAPAFSEYACALERVGCRVDVHLLRRENGFRLTEAILKDITAETDLVFLCQPNNPTGVTDPRELLLEILARCDDCGALLVADECFNGLLSDPEAHTLRPWLEGRPLLILNAFTKLYALPSLRLGFALSADRTLLGRMEESGPPWPVSGPAQAAGIAALADEAYPQRLRALLDRERPLLRSGLSERGAEHLSGEANFLLFYHEDRALADKLEEIGILLRRCEGFLGLSPGWYRTAVRTGEENRRLLDAVRQVTK